MEKHPFFLGKCLFLFLMRCIKGIVLCIALMLGSLSLKASAEDDALPGFPLERLGTVVDSVLYGSDMQWKFDVSRRLYDIGMETGRDLALLYGSTLLGISYLYDYDLDSSVYWLSNSIMLDSVIHRRGEPLYDRIMTMTYNNLGLVYINLAIDYYKATDYFLKALRRVDRDDSPGLYIALLTNLSIVHYFRDDPSGLEYARECYAFEEQHGGPTFMSVYSMALMMYVNGRYAEALNYADRLRKMEKADPNASPYDRRNVINTEVISGKIRLELGDYAGAKAAFERAISVPTGDVKADVAGAYLCYGEYLARQGYSDAALRMFKQGIELSREEVNYVHLQELYEKVAELYESIGESEEALAYYKKYQAVSDSITSISKEFALYESKARYQVSRYETLLRERQITILKKEKVAQLYLFICVAVICIAVGIWYWLKKKNLYYKKIVRQYQENAALSRKIREAAPQERYCYSALSEDKNEELFARVKELMEDRRLYRDGTLTLDKLSEMLSTNRSYLSRVINEKTGCNFNKYLNTYRVREAIGILSDKSTVHRQLKEIGSELGFNSPSTFYKAFSDETGMSPSSFRRNILSSDL